MLSRPQKFGQRMRELSSGYAFAEIRAVREELARPTDSTEAERAKLQDPRGFAAPLVTSALSAGGVFYLGRCIGIARCGHQAHQPRNLVLGVCVAVPYFAVIACTTTYYKYADVLDSVLCPADGDTNLARRLRALGLRLAPSETSTFLLRYTIRHIDGIVAVAERGPGDASPEYFGSRGFVGGPGPSRAPARASDAEGATAEGSARSL
mmetsp:Transcript_9671/g.34386  ORF Transcript_9671/g.34386 Transcript_9671/m.34386 type:complete len:208 (+) Transcript_9671:104-727(+)